MRPLGRRFASTLLCVLLLSAPWAHAAPKDASERAAQARTLLDTPQGATLMDLLGDPAVRDRLMAEPTAAHPPAPMTGSMGFMLDRKLGNTRQRLIDLGTQLRALPDALHACWDRVSAVMPASDTAHMFIYLVAFIAGGIAAQRLFRFAARPWLAHFDRLDIDTLEHRLTVLVERLAFAILLLGTFAAGSMGIFLLFSWPASSGSMILGYLWASLLIRFNLTVSRFFLAPATERLRLVPLTTRRAWFWHRWIGVLSVIGALGWQTIVVLRGLGLPPESQELLRQILLLAPALCGIAIVWTRRDSQTPLLLSPRRAALRLLVSFALLLIWLLFLTHATQAALSLLVIGAVPIGLYVLRNAAARVIRGQWLLQGEEVSAVGAIADRCMQAVVVVAAAFALIEIWQIDMASVASSETAMTRIGRGTFEALVILMGADLLWLVLRAVIDMRLTGAVVPIDDLDDEELRRRARIRTLLPVLRNFLFIFVLIIASLSALAAMGLQIGPLLAGAGVVGIAVGFGAQTLVRDVLSGVFFLLDDAFRVGELIESGGISGTVETFSLRSVKLRHYKGPLHTVPFGDLKAITNYSRDWVNEVLDVAVVFEADLERIESAIERVSNDVMQDLSLASGIITPPRSIGVTAMSADGIHVGIIVRTRPGQQFRVRAVLFNRLKSAFDADGVRFFGQTPVPAAGPPG
ncbi:mechanosensitive ion channel family protein [Acidisphaera sp. S103]|uniref:mechanosensitive ion channel family protein n=1 Tax=Acidisphaera sp. S103 TaxID=1747223 RepID=UPI00131DF30A|nr:mechanosensitive ion channel domain-containing protein [Acidisphaera sp. S103]